MKYYCFICIDKPTPEGSEASKEQIPGLAIKEEEKSEQKEEEQPASLMSSDSIGTKQNQNNRILKGVMRVGPLCTGLLLKGQLAVELVVLCAGEIECVSSIYEVKGIILIASSQTTVFLDIKFPYDEHFIQIKNDGL